MNDVVARPAWKCRMVDDVFEERNVGLHAADAELAQRAVHALAGHVESRGPTR